MKISESRLPYYRMAGYTITILMHSANTYVMLSKFSDDVMDDPNIQLFSKFIYIFITCWTYLAQTVHATLGMSCDLITLAAGDQYKFLKHVKQARDTLFASIVFPFTLLVSSCFWPLFLFDRELVLPYYTTKIVGRLSNHIMHTAIVPAAFWELVFQPRQTPSSHRQNIALMTAFTASYLVALFKTFFELGAFPYPLMTALYGSVHFVTFMMLVLGLLPIYYVAQWHASGLIWSDGEKDKHS